MAGVFLAAGAAVGMGFVHLYRTDPFFRGSVVGSYELPEDQIRPAFRRITDHDLPETVRNVRGIWFGGREPQIFVVFDTDPAGIAAIERMFAIPQAQVETLERSRVDSLVASGWTGFASPSVWQEKTGRLVFDPSAFGAGRMISYSTGGLEGWQVYIDDEHGTVYIYFWPYT